MNDKYAKEIARELRLIRKELEKSNNPPVMKIDGENLSELTEELKRHERAGERVTIK